MPPLAPPRTDDGPMCRVCGCTRRNACLVGYEIVQEGDNAREVGVGCEWVETSGNDVPRWLCSACSGTADDLMEVINRSRVTLSGGLFSHARAREVVSARAMAAAVRYEARLKLEEGGKS
jgi:hypothetical protein